MRTVSGIERTSTTQRRYLKTDHMVEFKKSENRMAEKLSSRTGASITFALLLFLVCAALSAVILVAATTASGRMSSIAGTDQRYYSVTSAADLLRDELSGGTVSTFIIGGKRVYFDCHMNEITYGSIADAVGSTDDGVPDTVAGADPDVAAAEGPLTVEGGISEALADLMIKGSGGSVSYTLSAAKGTNGSGGEIDSLKVDINGTIIGDILELYVSSKGYKILLRFRCDKRDVYPPVSVSGDYTISESYEITWDLIEMVNAYDYTMSNND